MNFKDKDNEYFAERYDYKVYILTDSYEGYRGTIEWSDDGKCWFGKVLGIPDLITYESDQYSTLEKEFQNSVDFYLEMCDQISKEPQTPHIAHDINDEFKEQLKTTLDCLEAICDVAYDYDGERSIRGVLDLIAEMYGIAQHGRCLIKGRKECTYGSEHKIEQFT